MQVRDETQESGYSTPDQPGGIPGWHEGIPVFRISTCGVFTIEMLIDVPDGDPTQAHYIPLPLERWGGRGPGTAQKIVKLLLSQEGRYASKDWLCTYLSDEQEGYLTERRLENILSYLRCHLLSLPTGKKLKDLVLYIRSTKESGDGYRLAGYPLLWVDVDALAWNVKQACLKERFGEDPSLYWERAYALASRGPFLLEETLSDWAMPQRERVEAHLRQCVHALTPLDLARYGEKGEEEVLRRLSSYCRLQPRDEDALRPFFDLLCKRGRYQEALESYARLEDALEEAGTDKRGVKRTPQPLTTEIADFARLKLREVTGSRIVEGKQQHLHHTREVQQENLHAVSLSVPSPAHGRLLLQEMLGLAASAPLPEKTSFLAKMPVFVSAISEESIKRYEATITYCWELYYSGGALLLEQFLPTFLSQIAALTQHPSRYQEALANITSRTYQLVWLLHLQHQDFGQALSATKQSFIYAELAKDANLLLASLVREAHTYFHINNPTQQLFLHQKALQYVKNSSPLLQSWLYLVLGESHAHLHQKTEADHFIGLAKEIFPEKPEQDPNYSYVPVDSFWFANHEVMAYLHLDRPTDAWNLLTQFGKIDPSVPLRVEFMNRQLSTILALRDLPEICNQFELAVQSSKQSGSTLRFREVCNVYISILSNWPHEPRVKKLGEFLRQ